MLNIIIRSTIHGFAVVRFRERERQPGVAPGVQAESKAKTRKAGVLTCRVRKAKGAHVRKAGEIIEKA